jgi:hypothetical protein
MSMQPASSQRLLPSERVVISAPMSFTGSTVRLWRLAGHPQGTTTGKTVARAAVASGVVLLILMVWMLVLCWYLTFTVFLVPYRVLRRGSRKRRKLELQHRETLEALRRNGS